MIGAIVGVQKLLTVIFTESLTCRIRKEILGWGQERIFNVAMNVNNYHTIVDYLNAMAVASKKLTETLYLPTLLITIQLTMHYLPLFNTN